jgi:anhydro-N-acetylmuramic acid kinase
MKQRPSTESLAPSSSTGRSPVTDGAPHRRPGSDALARVRDYLTRREHLIVGLMSGTSADGVDAVLARIPGGGLEHPPEILAHRGTPFEPSLRREILEVAAAPTLAPERVMRLDGALGECYAAAVLSLLADAGVDSRALDAIGSHGQTIRHVPRDAGDGEAWTLQIGSAAVLAERTGVTVLSNFRARDTAAGGEGAPLVPIADWWLFRSRDENRVLLNLGGMANVTYLGRDAGLADVLAFDTGPGNAVLDALVRIQSEGTMEHDEGGSLSARGTASGALLSELLADPFFALPPPRSTGRERFGERYAQKLREVALGMGLSEDDVLATAVELTAASVAQGIERFLTPRGAVGAVFASGGGVRNATLMAALGRLLAPVRVRPLSDLGVEPEAKEALAFALLAHLTLSGLPGNVPSATGATHPVVLGQITPGASA